ncbi:uncharacterized protein HMPREF1541_01042 [Cyphellophora europaea CBS 101466]|uniref:Uncharacterized protein n=1 Tax=Cyphellophora europaea (strain CBS 101466) TaxID=1220924 RepID=W2SFQ0_CYPE1|nr:uncharacterized protein HMPREF1541_01042 [Cyphellophora europaea CBS 101466]ETN46853.1 hypothetical protein HMPREF1541_01042 [Cyphellophora europaea CBS 101466]
MTKPRKTLRQALRDLLRRTKDTPTNNGHYSSPVGSGILRKAPSIVPQIPSFSTVSVFSDFSTVEDNVVYTPSSWSETPAALAPPANTSSDRRLLPAKSMSQISLSTDYLDPGGPQQVLYESVPSAYRVGASRQASLASITTASAVSLRPQSSVSTLRIRKSASSLAPRDQPSILAPPSIQPRPSTLRTTPSLKRSSRREPGTSRNRDRLSASGSALQAPSAPPARPTVDLKRRRTPLSLVEHFKCFVVLDTARQGCPVSGTSADLRYIFDIGENFVLNNQECEGNSMDIVSGLDAAGNEVLHLVLFTPLIVPSSGRHRFMLVSLIDVTDFVAESANQIPELDTISEEASFTDEIATPSAQSSPHWSTLSYKLSADDLLSGCSLQEDDDDFAQSSKRADEDIWLALAATEGGFRPNRPRVHGSSRSSQASPARSSVPSHASTTDDILDDFMSQLQELYSDFFLLGRSPLADDALEICNISPRVYQSRSDWMEGHLSHTAPVVIEQLSMKLGGVEPFTMRVRWGTRGLPKQLYCSPLYAGHSITWICYLVDELMPLLW